MSVWSLAARGARRPQRLCGPVHRDFHVGRVELGEHGVPLAVRHGDLARQLQDAVALDISYIVRKGKNFRIILL